MRQFGILIAIALSAGQPTSCAEILHIDPEAQTALSRPARAELGLIGVNVHRLRGNVPLDLARDAGFRFVRAELGLLLRLQFVRLLKLHRRRDVRAV